MVKREYYLTRIRKFYHMDLIKVITGIRRCGKSVLLKQIMEERIFQRYIVICNKQHETKIFNGELQKC